METNTDHFPEDKDAPLVKENFSFFKNFYREYKKTVDIIVFCIISVTTVISVSLSVYIVIVKYF